MTFKPIRHFILHIITLSFFALLILSGCTSIYVAKPILTEANADTVSLAPHYRKHSPTDWSNDIDFDDIPVKAVAYAQNIGEMNGNKPSKGWLLSGIKELDGQSNSYILYAKYIGDWIILNRESSTGSTTRIKKQNDNRYLLQLTQISKDGTPENESLICAARIYGKGVVVALKPRDARIKELLSAVRDSVRGEVQSHGSSSDSIIFDEIASVTSEDEIIDFSKKIFVYDGIRNKHSYLLDIESILSPIEDKEVADAYRDKFIRKAKERSAKWASERRAAMSHISVGSKMVWDTGFGILGYRDVIVIDKNETRAQVKISTTNQEIFWVSPSSLITQGNAAQQKTKMTFEILGELFKE